MQKNVLITGATSGIGYELAKLFAAENYNMILVARNKENLRKTATELKEIIKDPDTTITTIAIDLFERESAKEVYDITEGMGIFIDVLINNVGQGQWGRFFETNLDRQLNIMELNTLSVVSLTQYYLKDMVEKNRGKILFVASSLSKAPSPYMAVYAATKAFVYSFSQALIKEIEETKITITTLLPGPADTDFFHKAEAQNTVTYKEKKLQFPEKIAIAAFKALNEGNPVVFPGFQNKFQKIVNTIISDQNIVSCMEKKLRPSAGNVRKLPSHIPSLRERVTISTFKETGSGDY